MTSVFFKAVKKNSCTQRPPRRLYAVHATTDDEKQTKGEQRMRHSSPTPDGTRRRARHSSHSTLHSIYPHYFSLHKNVADQSLEALP
ncbi:hypothetical protein EVAR_45797_1 [Eumeta japonica]|uniref:Uncharacterized protein n=1 Tax=Eumeta variegata TaxID=151549 RepID=A0A4C1X247_EUMVA|nr:hypothetical protein EVAR_45797_1 [Eumeta japonica]